MVTPSIGLVLEGGGMRGAYTAGVLDAFMDQGIEIPYVIGVSAGANAGANYVSGQRERNRRVFIDFVRDRRYAGLRNLWSERSWFGMKFLFETLPEKLLPFDYQRFQESAKTFTVCATDGASGESVYFAQKEYDPYLFVRTIMRASSSLPLLAPPVAIDGRNCFDGGVSDSIPIERSLADGNQFNVVILTRNAGYRRKPARLGAIPRRMLAGYPRIIERLNERHRNYNACLNRIERLEREGRVFVFRPEAKLIVGRMERNPGKLADLYDQGYLEARERVDALKKWMDQILEIVLTEQ